MAVLHRAAEMWHTRSNPPRGTLTHVGQTSGTARRGRLGDRFVFEAVSNFGLLVHEETGRILDAGDFAALKNRYSQACIVDHGASVMIPGFVDAHLHFPQMDMMGSYGKHLIQWLESYIFPAEARFVDDSYAAAVATRFVRELARNGISSSVVFSSVHPASAKALFEAIDKSGLRAVIGKTSMDVNAPASVLMEWQADIEAQEALIRCWHKRHDRLFYAVTPRFVLTSSAKQMTALADLHSRHPDTFIQTHISECEGELSSVREAFPSARDYLSIYEDFGLVNDRTLLGHGIWLSDGERQRIAEKGATVVHCPTSNTFLGSGMIDLKRTCDAGVEVALGSDIGAGTSLSPWVTMLEAYKIQALLSQSPDPSTLLYLATLAGAEALHMDDRTGSLEPGKYADFQLISLEAKDLLYARVERAGNAKERLFATIVHGDDRLLQKLFVAGRPVFSAVTTDQPGEA
jgi:guanine deaminase